MLNDYTILNSYSFAFFIYYICMQYLNRFRYTFRIYL
jgi:hypothetical protein